MKFVCPSCKAKYQIADERVAGRSVKMKCRQCAAVIRISEASVELADKMGPTVPPPAPSEPVAAPEPVLTAPRVPRVEAAVEVPSVAPRMDSPSRPPKPSAAGLPPRPAPPRSSGAAGAGLGVAPSHSADFGIGLVAKAAASTPLAVRAGAPPVGHDARFFPSAPGHDDHDYDENTDELDDNEQTQVATLEQLNLGGLAGAFQQAVSAPAATALEALNMPSDDWYVGINGVPAGPMRLGELRSKASSGAVDGESLVWRDGFEDWKPLKSFPELLAIIEDVVPRPSQIAAAPPPSVTAVGQLADPFGGPGGGASAEGATDLEVAGLPRRSGPPAFAWLAIVAAMGLGFTVSYVVFGGTEKTETITKYVTVETPAGQVAGGSQGPAEATPEAAGDPAGKQSRVGGPNRRVGGVPTKASPDDPKGKTGGLAGLAGLKGVSGPVGPVGESTTGNSGQPLDSVQVQKTVSRYTSSVKRSCWQPALDTRDANAPSSAKVQVTIKVSPTGSVQSASTSGDPPGYRGLSSCIAARVRGWQFPASSGSTTVNVPFVFAAQ